MNYAENVKYASLEGKVAVITGGASGIGEKPGPEGDDDFY